MPTEKLELIEPSEKFRAEFEAYCREFAGGQEIHGDGGMENAADFAAAVRRCRDWAQGRNLPASHVPSHTFWLIRDQRTMIGTVNLRHSLNTFLKTYGGYIGYSVRPSEQGKGYATKMLALTLEKARALDLKRVLITCDKSNVASARVIQKNGGVFQDEVPSKEPGGEPLQRYWIELG